MTFAGALPMPWPARSALLALIVTTIAACSPSAAKDLPPAVLAVPVRVVPIEDSLVARPIVASARLAVRDEARLSFKIGGVIARIAAREGERVRRGAVLASLDMREIDAQVAKAQSALNKVERDAVRAQTLYADSVVTLSQLQDAQTGVEVARADLEVAKVNRRYAAIVAPSEGTILQRLAEPGELATSGGAVLVFGGATGGMVMQLGVPDRDVVRMRSGDRATIAFDAFPGRVFEGAVIEIGAAASAVTGTYAVELLVRGGSELASGLVGRVEVTPANGQAMRLVPIEALVEADGARGTLYSLSPDGRVARRHAVVIGFIQGARVAITSGLEGATRIVTTGAAYLDNGVAVKVLP